MKEHTIVLDAYEDITTQDYILEVGKAQLTFDLLQELRIIEYVYTSQAKHVLINLRSVIQTCS